MRIMNGIRLKWRSLCNGCSRNGLVFGFYFLLLSFDFVAITSGVSVGRLAAFATIALCLFEAPRWRLRLDGIGALVSAFSFICICSLFSIPVGFNEYNAYFTVFLNILIVVIACAVTFTTYDVLLWKRCLIFAAILLGVLAIVSPGQVGSEWVSGRVVPNVMGSQQDPNEFCGYYLLPVATMTYFGIQRRNPAYIALLVFFFYTVLMTGSRGGLMAVGVAFAVALAAAVRNDKHKIPICLAAIFILLMLALKFESILRLFPDAISSRFLSGEASTGTAESRMAIWRQLISAFFDSNVLQQLFGHGFGTTTLANSAHLVAHNVYIELLYDVGILGLISFVGMLIAACLCAAHKRDYVVLAAILGEAVLIVSLSSFWSKTLWGLLILGYVAIKDCGFDYEH